jgi:hypothetical protein
MILFSRFRADIESPITTRFRKSAHRRGLSGFHAARIAECERAGPPGSGPALLTCTSASADQYGQHASRGSFDGLQVCGPVVHSVYQQLPPHDRLQV